MKKILFILLALLFVGCSHKVSPEKVEGSKVSDTEVRKKYKYTFLNTFDTAVDYIEYSKSEEEFNKNKNFIESEFKRLHKLYDNYNNYEGVINVKTLNDRAGTGSIEVDDDLFNLVKVSISYYKEISKNTNIAMGSVLDIWHKYREMGLENPKEAKLPSMKELKEAADHMNTYDIVLDEEKKTIEIKDSKLKIDLGAVAKGYAVEMVCNQLKERGVDSFMLSAGGNVKTVGNPKDGKRANWGVGIQNPDNAKGKSDERISDALYLKDLSVVTSGDYQRFYTVDGKDYHHIINPKSLMPEDYFPSVTVVTEDSARADFLSTASFLMPFDESKKFIEGQKGVEAVWILKDGKIEATDGIKDMLESSK